MNFKPHKADTQPAQGPAHTSERVAFFPNTPPAAVEDTIHALYIDLEALPDHTPVIVDTRIVELQNNTLSIYVRYRLIGPHPAPTL